MINWQPTLETGIPVVDRDHRALIDQINGLSDALHAGVAKEKLADALVFLNRYVREHFQREENIMQIARCPAHRENCAAHAALTSKLDAWVARLQTGGATTSLVLEVHRDCSAWIQAHIVRIDCKLRDCGRQQ
jgi:hemerythrin